MTTKTFPIADVLGITTGMSLASFDGLHELAEHLLGHAVWTHEFSEKALWDRMREAMFAQHPQLRDAPVCVISDGARVDEALWRPELAAYLADMAARYGATLDVVEGKQARTESPFESAARIAPGKPVLAIVMDDSGDA